MTKPSAPPRFLSVAEGRAALAHMPMAANRQPHCGAEAHQPETTEHNRWTYVCTRPAGHSGEHAAHDTTAIIGTWPNASEPRTTIQVVKNNGAISSRSKPVSLATARQWLDNLVEHWDAANQTGVAKARSIVRENPDSLRIVTTAGVIIQINNLPKAGR